MNLARLFRACWAVLRGKASHLDCMELRGNASAYLEGEVSPGQKLRYDRHVRLCLACSAFLEGLRKTIAALRGIPPESLPADAKAKILRQIGPK